MGHVIFFFQTAMEYFSFQDLLRFVHQQAAILEEQMMTNERQSSLIEEQSVTVRELLVTVEEQSVTNQQQANLIQTLRDENRVGISFTLFKTFSVTKYISFSVEQMMMEEIKRQDILVRKLSPVESHVDADDLLNNAQGNSLKLKFSKKLAYMLNAYYIFLIFIKNHIQT